MNSIDPCDADRSRDRFWSKVDRSGGTDTCWLWNGAISGGAYGYYAIRLNKLQSVSGLAHRWAWILTYGAIPDGLRVCHHCDTPPCCNPAHLFLGTDADNTQDKLAKGRQHSRLTWEQVREIRQLGESGFLLKDIASRFGIVPSQISLILQCKRWRNDPLEGIAPVIPVNAHPYISRENSRFAKLTWEQVREIRGLGKDGWTQRELANRYNINQPLVGRILRGESWHTDPLEGTAPRIQLRNRHHATGEKHGNAKLTWEQVREIRQLGTSGWKCKDIAIRYGIGQTSVKDILHGKRWRDTQSERIS